LQSPCYGQLLFGYSKFSQMILRRLGNKKEISGEIQKYFPSHKIYIEPFFGAGGMYFYKPQVQYNFLNDIDNDVFNLFMVVKENKEELADAFLKTPLHQSLLSYWKQNEEKDPIQKAVRFLFISNCTLHGNGGSLRMGTTDNPKQNFFDNINATFEKISTAKFSNCDFRDVIKKIGFIQDGRNQEQQTLIYADPPYLETKDNYSHSFKEQDANDLFELLVNSKCKFAYSEFDHPFILEQAKQRNLNVIIIGERQNLKNRRTEILITNYEKQKGLFD